MIQQFQWYIPISPGIYQERKKKQLYSYCEILHYFNFHLSNKKQSDIKEYSKKCKLEVVTTSKHL